MLVVNCLCHCKDHRLEICGKCGYNFRLLGEDMDKDPYLAEELDKIGGSIRRAPSRQIVPFELYEPVVNDAILGVPSDLDVITFEINLCPVLLKASFSPVCFRSKWKKVPSSLFIE